MRVTYPTERKNMTQHFCLPSDISPEQFLSEYWQKKPLLIKQGLPQLVGMFKPDDIIGLAQDEDATARLISENNQQWSLKTSPFTAKDFQKLPKHWSVLVQNMEQWSPALGNLWHAFDFIPQWQRDDIMVSYAPSGGSVGKHYDNYDVFLAQGYGKRHWQLGKYCDQTTQFEAGQPIRLMNEMGELIFDEVLEPGDVLYVPTNLSHYGVAVDDCLTFSFGFRRPTPLQLLDSLADIATHFDDLAIPFKINQPAAVAGELSIASVHDIKAQLIALLNSELGDEIITQAISETVSKRQYELMLPDTYADIDEIQSALAAGAVIMQDMSSRIIFTQTQADSKTQAKIYVNGCAIDADDIPANAQSLLIRLANGESIDEQILQAADVETDIICDWIENGWVVIDYPEEIIG